MKLLPLEQEQQWIPQRLVQTLPSQFLLWTFVQRKVFALVDGKRTITQIAWLLSVSQYESNEDAARIARYGHDLEGDTTTWIV